MQALGSVGVVCVERGVGVSKWVERGSPPLLVRFFARVSHLTVDRPINCITHRRCSSSSSCRAKGVLATSLAASLILSANSQASLARGVVGVPSPPVTRVSSNLFVELNLLSPVG